MSEDERKRSYMTSPRDAGSMKRQQDDSASSSSAASALLDENECFQLDEDEDERSWLEVAQTLMAYGEQGRSASEVLERLRAAEIAALQQRHNAEHHAQPRDERIVNSTRKRNLGDAFPTVSTDDNEVAKVMRQDTPTVVNARGDPPSTSSDAPTTLEALHNDLAVSGVAPAPFNHSDEGKQEEDDPPDWVIHGVVQPTDRDAEGAAFQPHLLVEQISQMSGERTCSSNDEGASCTSTLSLGEEECGAATTTVASPPSFAVTASCEPASLPVAEEEEPCSSAALIRGESEWNDVARVILADRELGGSVREVLQPQLASDLSALQHRRLAAFDRELGAGQDVQAQSVGGSASGNSERSTTLVDGAGGEDGASGEDGVDDADDENEADDENDEDDESDEDDEDDESDEDDEEDAGHIECDSLLPPQTRRLPTPVCNTSDERFWLELWRSVPGLHPGDTESRRFYRYLAEMTAQDAAKVRSRYDAFCKGYDYRSEPRPSNDANQDPHFFEHSERNGADFSLTQIRFFFTLWFRFKHPRQVRRMPGQAAVQALWKYFYERHRAIHAIITRVLDCTEATYLCEAINDIFSDDDDSKEDAGNEGCDNEDDDNHGDKESNKN